MLNLILLEKSCDDCCICVVYPLTDRRVVNSSYWRIHRGSEGQSPPLYMLKIFLARGFFRRDGAVPNAMRTTRLKMRTIKKCHVNAYDERRQRAR